MAEECPIDCQIKSQIECPIEFPIKCQLCHIECPIECPIKCQHICHNMECQNRMPGWMFYFGKMLGNVCQMECRNVCQITCHKKIWCQKICHGRVVFLKKIIRSLMAPSPPISPKLLLVLLQQLTLPMQHTLHVVLHEAGRRLGIYDPTAHGPHKLLDASWRLGKHGAQTGYLSHLSLVTTPNMACNLPEPF